METILISLLFFAYCLLICEVGRVIVRWFIRDYECQLMWTEFFGTLQICVVLYEARVVFFVYGVHVYTVCLFALVVVHCVTIRFVFGTKCVPDLIKKKSLQLSFETIIRSAMGNPCAFVYMYRALLTGPMYMMSMLAVQALAGYTSWHIARYFWSYHLLPLHVALYNQTLCESGIHVEWPSGFAAEAIATFINRIITLFATTQLPRLWPVIVALTWAVLVRLGLNITGCYQNPVLASALTLRCDWNVRLVSHIIVYWAGPVTGFMLASHIYFYRWGVLSMWYQWWNQWMHDILQPLITIDSTISDIRSNPHHMWYHLFAEEETMGQYAAMPSNQSLAVDQYDPSYFAMEPVSTPSRSRAPSRSQSRSSAYPLTKLKQRTLSARSISLDERETAQIQMKPYRDDPNDSEESTEDVIIDLKSEETKSLL